MGVPVPFTEQIADASGGLLTNRAVIARPGLAARTYRRCDNAVFRKDGSYSVRAGSYALNNATINAQAAGVAQFLPPGGTFFHYVAGDTGIWLALTTGFTAQTLPGSYPASSNPYWHIHQVNAALVAAQVGATLAPIAGFQDLGVAEKTKWVTCALPAPGAAPTLAQVAFTGGVDVGLHTYRVRHRFKHGSSEPSATQNITVLAATEQVNVTLPTASTRVDYLGWTLERTKLGDPNSFYFVADGTAGTYSDTKPDADLFYRSDDELHRQPPVCDGIAPFLDRMVAWKQSNLYVSQAVGDAEGTGPFNFDPEQLYRVAPDDGDDIHRCLEWQDRLAVLKGRNVHVLEGFGPPFALRKVFAGAGVAGPRAAVVVGSTLFFYGAGGVFVGRSPDDIKQIGWAEVAEYTAEIDPARELEVALWGFGTDFVGVSYKKIGRANEWDREIVVLDLRNGTWTHWANLDMAAATFDNKIIGTSADPRLIYVDQRSGQSKAWVAMQGTGDERLADKTGGVPTSLMVESHPLDQGAPSLLKNIERVEAHVSSPKAVLNVQLFAEPDQALGGAQLSVVDAGKNWDDDAGTEPAGSVLIWDEGDWATESELEAHSGLPDGTTAKRWFYRVRAECTDVLRINALIFGGHILPDRVY